MIGVPATLRIFVAVAPTDLRLGYDDYSWIAAQIQRIADSCCPGRVVAMLEGGYSLYALARSVEHFLRPFISGDMTP